MKILLTGHSGFKGSWLSLMLKEDGHRLFGISLPPEKASLFELANMKKIFDRSIFLDIRDKNKLEKKLLKIQPELVIHLAAQPLVRYSYKNPVETFSTNVEGTLNILASSEAVESIKTILVITTDKVYRNEEKRKAFIESDPLGGSDPYSTSKAMADLLAQSWGANVSRKSVFIARAGNVIGGGDFAADRLIPDLFRGIQHEKIPILRNPLSVRPWQHVLDCLNGYLRLAETKDFTTPNLAWNFGPEPGDYRDVRAVTKEFLDGFGLNQWREEPNNGMHEADFLTLDSTRAKSELQWRNKLDFSHTVDWTFEWYRRFLNGESPFKITSDQVARFRNL